MLRKEDLTVKKLQNIILNLTHSISDPQNAPKLLVGTGKDKITCV